MPPVQVEELEHYARLDVAARRAEVESQAARTNEQTACDEVIHSQKEKHEESEEPEEAESAQNEHITQILSCSLQS